jgi:hypothetical protein
MKPAIFVAVLLVTNTTAWAAGVHHARKLPVLPDFDHAPQKDYQRFRDEVIWGGKCLAWHEIAARKVPLTPAVLAENHAALAACWLDFIAPQRVQTADRRRAKAAEAALFLLRMAVPELC